MKAFGWFFPFAAMVFASFSLSLASDTTTACIDLATDGADITHIFVDSGCEASASELFITADGEPVTELHTNDGPCPDFPRDVWFRLKDKQATTIVCVSVQEEDCQADIQVYGKAGDECIVGTMP